MKSLKTTRTAEEAVPKAVVVVLDDLKWVLPLLRDLLEPHGYACDVRVNHK